MPEYKCEICNAEFKRRAHLDYHTSHNACKDEVFKCPHCAKGYTTKASMIRHSHETCKKRKEDTNKKEEILDVLVKEKEKTDEQLKMLLDANAKIMEEMALLRGENQSIKKQVTQLEEKTNFNQNNINQTNNNNGLINNGLINNVILVSYGKEDMKKIDSKDILDAIRGFDTPIKLTKSVHFNPKYPEYHNVFISNIKNRYAMMYDNDKWKLILKDELINKIYEYNKTYIEDNFDEFIKSLTVSRKNALRRWLDLDEDEQKAKDIKEQLKLLLYNSRDIIENNMRITTTLMPKNVLKTKKIDNNQQAD
jgi:hypothetical protein